MTRQRFDAEPASTEPVQVIRMPLCYGCGVALAAAGYCGNCLGQTERELREFSANHQLPTHPVNGDIGIYNGQRRVWLNGYWINPLCAPDWIRERMERKASPKPTPKQKAELAHEHAHVREHYRLPDDVPF